MGQIKFSADARYFDRLGTNTLRKETTANNVTIGNCDVKLVPVVGNDDCSVSNFQQWGGGSIPSFTIDDGGFGWNEGIEAVGGATDWTVGPNPWQWVPFYDDLISPATGNESDFAQDPDSGLFLTAGQGACGRKQCQTSTVTIDNPQAAAIFQPCLITKKICVEYWWASGQFHLSFSNFTGISYGPNKWLDLTLSATTSIPDTENPLKTHELAPSALLIGYDQNGGGGGHPNQGTSFNAALVADVPSTMSVTIASNPLS